MKKIITLSAALCFMFYASSVQAVCPVCTVAVAAGVGLSRWLGIDDTITGLWIGGLTLSLITWTLSWFNKKNYNFFGKRTFTIAGYFALIVVPLFFLDIIGHPLNNLWGVDKLLLGIVLGSLIFWAGERFCCWLKKRNEGKAHFPFQKVAIPAIFLLIASFIFYFITK